jgi:hypothetical protein
MNFYQFRVIDKRISGIILVIIKTITQLIVTITSLIQTKGEDISNVSVAKKLVVKTYNATIIPTWYNLSIFSIIELNRFGGGGRGSLPFTT